ncbi:MAG: 50S ribosomal protein L10 [Arhodomonas sp.]|nr:50S ribosomal protein L10 [Arhodomonas sp.]
MSQGVYLKVVKNTLAKRAVEGTDFECMSEGFEGPLLIAFSQEDPGSAARVISRTSPRSTSKLVVKMVAVGGERLRRRRARASGQSADLRRGGQPPHGDDAVRRCEKLARTLNEVHAQAGADARRGQGCQAVALASLRSCLSLFSNVNSTRQP